MGGTNGYSDDKCTLCGDDDGFNRYWMGTNHSEKNAWVSVTLCKTCLKEVEIQDGYSHHFVHDCCPTCGHITNLHFKIYNEKDQGVTQCSKCGEWFKDIWNDTCEDCRSKAPFTPVYDKSGKLIDWKQEGDDTREKPTIECPGCESTLEEKYRILPSGHQLKFYECWKCGFESEPESGIYIKIQKPEKVEAMF